MSSKRKKYDQWDDILDLHIRSLKSKNARTIFQIFLEMKQRTALTTLDIEKKLSEEGVDLDKKEINGWLSSLLKAGLITKDKKRGKPTTFQYDDKYTFDLWYVTPLGLYVAYSLTHFQKKNSVTKELDPKSTLKSIKSSSTDEINNFFRQIDELNILSRILHIMAINPKQINSSSIAERLMISPEKIDGILEGYLENSDLHIFVRKASPYGIKERFRNILGLTFGIISYSLTEEGRHLAEFFKLFET